MTEPDLPQVDDPNGLLAIIRSEVSTMHGIFMTADAMEQAGSPQPRNIERENEHLRSMYEAFIQLDRLLSSAGKLPQEWTAERSIVLVIRDPDADNQFVGEGEPVGLFDIDTGRANFKEPAELEEWLNAQRSLLAELEERGSVMCSEAVRGVIAIIESIHATAKAEADPTVHHCPPGTWLYCDPTDGRDGFCATCGFTFIGSWKASLPDGG